MKTPDEIRSAKRRLAAKRDALTGKTNRHGALLATEYKLWLEALDWVLGDDQGTVGMALAHLPELGQSASLFKGQK